MAMFNNQRIYIYICVIICVYMYVYVYVFVYVYVHVYGDDMVDNGIIMMIYWLVVWNMNFTTFHILGLYFPN